MPPDPGTGRLFMEKTKYRYLTTSDQEKYLPQPPLEVPPDPEKPVFSLPEPETISVPSRDLRTAIEERHSVRAYVKEPLTIPELAFLLWCTQGVKKVAGTYATFRTVPSAGARHALETYLLINSVVGLEPGLYRYLALTHHLQQLVDPAPDLLLLEAVKLTQWKCHVFPHGEGVEQSSVLEYHRDLLMDAIQFLLRVIRDVLTGGDDAAGIGFEKTHKDSQADRLANSAAT